MRIDIIRIVVSLLAACAFISVPVIAQDAPLRVAISDFDDYYAQVGWEAFLQEFAAADESIETLEYNPNGFLDNADCYISDFSGVRPANYAAQIAPVTAVFETNMALAADYPPQLLESLYRDGELYEFPLWVHPLVLALSIPELPSTGVPTGDEPLTPIEFENLLEEMRHRGQATPHHLSTRFGAQDAILNILTVYGADLLDLSTDPLTVQFNSRETLIAVERVVKRIQDLWIGYDSFTIGRSVTWGLEPIMVRNLLPMYQDEYTRFWDRAFVLFPVNPRVPIVDYFVTSGYVNAESDQFDACMRLFEAASLRPDLALGLPARRSLAGEAISFYPELDTAMLYSQFETGLAMTADEIVPSGELAALVDRVNYWMLGALQNIVLDGMAIPDALEQAQAGAERFLDCVNDPSTEIHDYGYSEFDNLQFTCLSNAPEAEEWLWFPG